MTPDECRKVFAYLEAVWTGDDGTRADLDGRVHSGGRTMQDLLVFYLEEVVQRPTMLTAGGESAHGWRDADGRAGDLGLLLVDTLREWARVGGEEGASGIAHGVTGYLLACLPWAQGDLPTALPYLREVAARAWPQPDTGALSTSP
jgi:hypothetical protein